MSDSFAKTDAVLPRDDFGLPVVAMVTTSECAPCVLLKPIVRKLALQFSGLFLLVEIEQEAAANFCREHQILRFPELLLFRDGTLCARRSGFDELAVIQDWLLRSLRPSQQGASSTPAKPGTKEVKSTSLQLSLQEDDLDLTFDVALANAKAAVDERMRAAREEIDDCIKRIQPALDVHEAQLCDALAKGTLKPAEAQSQRVDMRKRLQAPFRDKIDALHTAQVAALQQYEAITDAGLRTYAEALGERAGKRLCSPDGGWCEVTPLSPMDRHGRPKGS